VALVDHVLDALAGTEGEMVLFPKSERAGDGLPPFPLFLGKRGRRAGDRFQSVFDDFLGERPTPRASAASSSFPREV
jgi:hypothetical protein